jgi:hypothetical protein
MKSMFSKEKKEPPVAADRPTDGTVVHPARQGGRRRPRRGSAGLMEPLGGEQSINYYIIQWIRTEMFFHLRYYSASRRTEYNKYSNTTAPWTS